MPRYNVIAGDTIEIRFSGVGTIDIPEEAHIERITMNRTRRPIDYDLMARATFNGHMDRMRYLELDQFPPLGTAAPRRRATPTKLPIPDPEDPFSMDA